MQAQFTKKLSSLRIRVTVLIFLAAFTLIGFLIGNNAYAISVVQQNVFKANSELMSLYMNQVDSSLEVMENYWAGIQLSSDILILSKTEKEIDYYTAQARVKMDMEKIIQTYHYVDDLFIYFETNEEYLDAAKYGIGTSKRKEVERAVIAEIERQKLTGMKRSEWGFLEQNGNYYLVRIFQYRNIYMGGWVDVSNLLHTMQVDGFRSVDYLSFYANDGYELGDALPEMGQPLSISSETQTFSEKINGTKYLVITGPSRCGSYSLVAMIKDQSVMEGLIAFQKVIVALVICSLAFLFGFGTLIRRWILFPVNQLCSAMNQFQSGQGEILIQDEKFCMEFRLLSETFQNMITNIRSLKIDVYEEKVQRQVAQLQYLKLQINPHFYINCINIIHNLAIMKKNELICDLSTYLGNHLRYTMEGNTLDYLYREIEYVENYLHIQTVRFGDCFTADIEVEEAASGVMVPPLVIQTFIENTVKYQVTAGGHINIFIHVGCCMGADGTHLQIEIWDSGNGYSDEILTCLREGRKIYDKQGEHYGINNVVNRIHLIYKGEGHVEFKNHDRTGGAYIIITLPVDGGEESTDGSSFNC
ncbi:MAG: sensor histidine kinase [Lachnospiraceae bacterium]